jgi:hypothetical protein
MIAADGSIIVYHKTKGSNNLRKPADYFGGGAIFLEKPRRRRVLKVL